MMCSGVINEPSEFYQIDFTDTSFVEQTDDFMVISHESAELKCFAEHLCLTKQMYCDWFVQLVKLTMECNQLMVNYNQRVSKPTVFAVLFGYNEFVIGIVKKSLEEALSEDNDDDDLIVVSESESE